MKKPSRNDYWGEYSITFELVDQRKYEEVEDDVVAEEHEGVVVKYGEEVVAALGGIC